MRQFAGHVRFLFACPEMFLQVGSFLDCWPLGWIAPFGVGDLKVLESRPAVDATSRYRGAEETLASLPEKESSRQLPR